ncbi:MAG: hypothetical protein PHU25_11295 [Deltaproteobacteria bacterium]|nr:hypothetical protein [Deltaproteobacteria bacterium]
MNHVPRRWAAILAAMALLAIGLSLSGCSDEGRGDDDSQTGGDSDTDTDGDSGTDSDSATDTGGDSDSDSDSDSDTADCTPVTWGGGLKVGTPVANWSFNGYIDQNGDGIVETTAVDFDLAYIRCTHKRALVFMLDDTS